MMNSTDLIQIVTDQKGEVQSMEMSTLCDRCEERYFELDSSLAQIVIGVRRSGKSTMCHKVLQENNIHYAYVNFDDERLFNLEAGDLNILLEALYVVYGDFKYLFLDEVQNIDEWFLFVNRLLRLKIRMFITGSNAKLLSSELSTHLTGRYNKIELFPFSFSELCQYKGLDISDVSTKGTAFLKSAFNEYLMKGGFPELFEIKNRRNYIQNLFDSIIRRDIQQRFKVRYIDALHKLANHLVDNFSQEIVYTDLATRFGFGSHHTVENYVAYLKQAYLVIGIHKFSFKSKERIRNEKGYVVDLAFVGDREHSLIGENLGWRLENIVYIELLRRVRPLFYDVFYYRENYEIDFVVCERNHVKELIQVSYDISSKKTFNREISALKKASIELKCNKLTLINLDEKQQEYTEDDIIIKIVPIVDWLLSRLTSTV